MRRSLRLSRIGLVAFASLSATAGNIACSSSEGPPAFELDLGSQLDADTGVPWTLDDRAPTGEVRTMLPAAPVKLGGADPEAAAKAYVSIAGGVLCNSAKQTCKQRSSTDFSATYDLVHGLACE